MLTILFFITWWMLLIIAAMIAENRRHRKAMREIYRKSAAYWFGEMLTHGWSAERFDNYLSAMRKLWEWS